jgi:hypothetical protein
MTEWGWDHCPKHAGLRKAAQGDPPPQAFAAIHSSSTGAMRSRHLLPLKMP